MVSIARTSRTSGIASTVATADGGLKVTGVEVPAGSLSAMVAWIGDNQDRAAMVTDHRLKGVREAAAAILDEG